MHDYYNWRWWKKSINSKHCAFKLKRIWRNTIYFCLYGKDITLIQVHISPVTRILMLKCWKWYENTMSGYNISFITMHCLLTLLQGLIIVMPYQKQNNTKQHYSMLRLKYLEISIIYNLKYLEHDCLNLIMIARIIHLYEPYNAK